MTDGQWRHEWPWGRKSPARRLQDLRERQRQTQRRVRELRERFEERLRDFELLEQSIAKDIEIAEACRGEQLRREAKRLAAALRDRGVEVADRIGEGAVDEDLVNDLRATLERTTQGGNPHDGKTDLDVLEGGAGQQRRTSDVGADAVVSEEDVRALARLDDEPLLEE